MPSRNSNVKTYIKENASRWPVAVLRFIIFVPFGIYQGIAKNHWNVIKDHPEQLQDGVFNHLIAKGEHRAKTWGILGFYWSFTVWLPAIIVPPPFDLMFYAVDVVVAVMLSITTHLQSKYSPDDMDSCTSTGSHEWQLPPGHNESFFEASARLNATSTTPAAMCKSYVEEWQYGIVLSLFCSLIAFLGITSSIIIFLKTVRNNRRQRVSNAKWLLQTAAKFPKNLFAVGVGLVYIVLLAFRCLPLTVKSRVRYTRRYADKVMRKKPGVRHLSAAGGKPNSLADFLSIYDILMSVVPYLHYIDIINLSLASKSVHEAVLPDTDYDRRITHFRMYTCRAQSRKQCWVCTNQICNGCRVFRALPQTYLYHHLDNCRSYCSSCYWTHVQCSPPVRIACVSCHCGPRSPGIGGLFHSHGNPRNKCVARSVCWQCNILLDKELLLRREARTRAELREGKRASKCTREGCGKILNGSGPSWWVCKKCRRECTDSVHLAWRKKCRDVEVV
ncbi:hypothetical protein CC78DRAFT_543800 [Lojkania enalia]|uniref:Uncharacterized protein n=1 Tax=Lojkania enalia TaxID=147567 RepID=A0A9P4KBQ7_9PLEO|nr:hypothetical protein CC78DRAFT_543800 [Didymosphaeria enalia]